MIFEESALMEIVDFDVEKREKIGGSRPNLTLRGP